MFPVDGLNLLISPQKPASVGPAAASVMSQFEAFPPSAAHHHHHHQPIFPQQPQPQPSSPTSSSFQAEMDQLRLAHQEDKERLSFLQEKYGSMVTEFIAMKAREEQLMNQYKQLKQSHEELIMKLKEKILF